MKYVRRHYNVKCWYHEEIWSVSFQTYKECIDFLRKLEKEEIPDKIEILECGIIV